MKAMNIKAYNSNIEITFDDNRQSITLYSDNYFNCDQKSTADEEREYLADNYELSAEEVEEIIGTLLTHEWIEA